MPGNPISSAACFRFFVYPFIENILDILMKIYARDFKKSFKKKRKKFYKDLLKSKLSATKDGKLEVELLPGQDHLE